MLHTLRPNVWTDCIHKSSSATVHLHTNQMGSEHKGDSSVRTSTLSAILSVRLQTCFNSEEEGVSVAEFA